MDRLYTTTEVDNLITRYLDAGGSVKVIEEGVLGHGVVVLYDETDYAKLLNIVIKEVPLNEWSSAHRLRRYRKLPKKYADKLKEDI